MTIKPLNQRWWQYLHWILFALTPVLTLFSLNSSDVAPQELIRSLVIVLLGSGLLFGLVTLLTRGNAERAGLITSGFLFLFFGLESLIPLLVRTYLFIHSFLTASLGTDPPSYVRYGLILGLFFLLLGGLIISCLRVRKERLRSLTTLTWIGAVAIFLPTLWRILNYVTASVNSFQVVSSIKFPELATTSSRPDLYIIVLDAYARQDILHDRYDFDNEPFLKSLTARGFLIARHSLANYIQTPLALTAALNIDYLGPGQPTIDHNQIANVLKKQGYHFISIPTGFEPTATPSADIFWQDRASKTPWLAPHWIPFEILLREMTPLPQLPHWQIVRGMEAHRERILAAFNHLGDAAKFPYPKFIFAHILAPHPPFVFGADGNPRQPTGQTVFTLGDASDYKAPMSSYKPGYVGQVQFVNRRILETLDTIKANAKRPYVIVVMGDHGVRSHTDWYSRANTDVTEAFPNLFAVYTPPSLNDSDAFARLRQRLQGRVTPINALRAIMNGYFGGSYADLPDRNYYSTMADPLKFYDVTNDLRGK